ncbi:chemotaxis-specific protein-glutamate methyltransferase CheB [Natronolimnobius sp. AArcel1]|uniref:chemotaxis-specific protein-glutamate methyltransferase CheB n=1 Tax=Natronolimnobius sp. AArcel1 TaxID=1679093 RepID=UPI0013EA9EFD|nr:chemotaxis-specific protein-glutamate methyltransferase CheB [Natronolimnobius sp. AArcel1]NGM67526.1 chemotaxis-specific protein-glutamate methyltransferase CheB [Natronolimnobius sp. AArcel1]
MTRVLVVDDSQFFRTVVGNALTETGYTIETADDGLEAVKTAATFDPDVITMDVKMPELNGIDALERIMQTSPVPVIMASAYTEANADATFDALEAGAVDVIEKPDGSGSRNIAHFVDELEETIERLSDADISALALEQTAATAQLTRARMQGSSEPATSPTSARASAAGTSSTQTDVGTAGPTGADVSVEQPAAPLEDQTTVADDDAVPPTIIIGASTGGPKIVERVCAELPRTLRARVVIVQHMPADFTARFAERLDSRTTYDVTHATDGDWVSAGEAVVAPGDADLEITTDADGAFRVRLVDGGETIQPSIDVTMKSAATTISASLCGVVLSGMGSDGAAGIEAIAAAGGQTIAQDESTSPVFGIPCQAIETGCVDTVAPAGDLVDELVEATTTTGDSDD